MTPEVEVLAEGLYFPESLRWRSGELWFSDVFGRRVAKLRGTELTTVVEMDGNPSGLGWLPNGDLLVVSMGERRLLRLVDDALTLHADLSSFMDWPANDMVVTSSGYAFVGGYGFDADNGADPVASSVLGVDADGRARTHDAQAVFPNGFAVDADRGILYVAETFGDRISVYAMDSHHALRNGRVFAQLPEGYGPDGICLDSQGRLWVACAFASKVVRLDDAGGVEEEFSFGGEGVYCCAVTNESPTRLILALASMDEELAQRVPTGRIVAVRID